ncbi:uncharacterized protein L203_105399 [Cryptococcus depauperatus CBS 7841]|uniref:Uncharacterized protein n=1 Tax=Cryptococcus depauperatus CBS 7841 TaxID=1295531 RepID=A0A1E3ICN1_9TREE|nr:50S small subunit ribosomal protein L22 [Cryptococcus depauperatus CBS 7841]
MARPVKSLLGLASSLPGPSRIIRPAVSGQTRTAFNLSGWDRYLPSLPKWTSEEKVSESTKTIDESPSSESIPSDPSATTGNLFDSLSKPSEKKITRKMQKRGIDAWTEHSYKSAAHKISHRKLNLLSKQVAGLPIDEAIVQMQFSEKRASKWVKSTLALARDHAVDKNLKRDKLVVAEAWVSKGKKEARIDIKGRGRYGVKHHPSARIHFILREGKTSAEKQSDRYAKAISKVRSAGLVREDTPLRRKVISGWTW